MGVLSLDVNLPHLVAVEQNSRLPARLDLLFEGREVLGHFPAREIDEAFCPVR